jgi:hypothetical protein
MNGKTVIYLTGRLVTFVIFGRFVMVEPSAIGDKNYDVFGKGLKTNKIIYLALAGFGQTSPSKNKHKQQTYQPYPHNF